MSHKLDDPYVRTITLSRPKIHLMTKKFSVYHYIDVTNNVTNNTYVLTAFCLKDVEGLI